MVSSTTNNVLSVDSEPREQKQVSLVVNGQESSIIVDCRTTLAEALRENLGLYGTKIGCNRAECGTCTVIMEGCAIYSCVVLAVDADGKKIETIEGLERSDGSLHKLQQIFIDDDAVQCGYCVPGILMTIKALVDKRQEKTTTKDVRAAIAGNYCRCGIFPNVERAVADYLKTTTK